MPLHSLHLKVGAPVILMRNLIKANGTRLVVRRVHCNVLEAVIITGNRIGDICLILRIKSSSSDSNQPFALRRRQFPVRLAFAMSINEAHGQTMQRIGPTPSLLLLCHTTSITRDCPAAAAGRTWQSVYLHAPAKTKQTGSTAQ